MYDTVHIDLRLSVRVNLSGPLAAAGFCCPESRACNHALRDYPSEKPMLTARCDF
jgi:hypothetical protein